MSSTKYNIDPSIPDHPARQDGVIEIYRGQSNAPYQQIDSASVMPIRIPLDKEHFRLRVVNEDEGEGTIVIERKE